MKFLSVLLLSAFIFLPGLIYSQAKQENLLEEILKKESGIISTVINNPAKYEYQIIYTKIDRDRNNKPHFTSYRLGADSSEYFYPASSIKMATAILALQKLNELKIPGLTKFTHLRIDSAFSGQTPVLSDTSAPDDFPSIANYIKKIFLVSDNDAFNRLYEFLGQEYLNEELWKRGLTSTRLIHRLSTFLTNEENRHTNPFIFESDGKVIYRKPAEFNPEIYYNQNKGLLKGRGYYSGDSLVLKPKDFTYSNRMSVEDLHGMLKSVIFPESVAKQKRFNLRKDDYSFLYKYMSMLPRESKGPLYDPKEYYDGFGKFFMFGDSKEKISGSIRLFNKVGDAYGFLIDNAYVADLEKNIEFLLTAVVYVNEDQIFNDDKYEYDQVGYPFMSALGRAIYNYESGRYRKYTPDLTRFGFKYSGTR